VSNDASKGGVVRYLQEFSIPLIIGVACALLAANLAPDWYHHWFGHWDEAHPPWAFPASILGHQLTIHFLVNDIFMVFFFGIAAKEITEACLPGGSLNPPKKAINPLIATIGGVVGPVGVFFGAMFLFRSMGLDGYDTIDDEGWSALLNGWGVPTATDIALAWLVARTVFGKLHPAVNFLLLLAVADDAIGLVIIAIFYGDPAHPAAPEWLGLMVAGLAVAYALRKMNVQSWLPYVFIAGTLSWVGLMKAHMHPALALVPIIPFLPWPRRDTGLFASEDEIDKMGEATARDLGMHHSPLENYEHQTKAFVDFGLFFFAMANAGVVFGAVGALTWAILAALVIGKTIGIAGLGLLAQALGFPLPTGMTNRDLFMAAFIAALGLTVALFVSGAAYTDLDLQGQAKMGALASGLVAFVAVGLGKAMGFGKSVESST
jgi:Na+:H+ antiporter, NhaA family